MKTLIIEEKRRKNNPILEWFLYMIGYALILITVSVLFPHTLVLDHQYYGLWALIAAILIYILNKTIKPILVWLTLPLTALTLGIFYPFINVIILEIVNVILGKHFIVNGILMPCLVALLISFMNMLMDQLVLKPLLGKE